MIFHYKADKFRYTIFSNVRLNNDVYLKINPVYWLLDSIMSLSSLLLVEIPNAPISIQG